MQKCLSMLLCLQDAVFLRKGRQSANPKILWAKIGEMKETFGSGRMPLMKLKRRADVFCAVDELAKCDKAAHDAHLRFKKLENDVANCLKTHHFWACLVNCLLL